MPYIANKLFFDQNLATKNKKLISIICFLSLVTLNYNIEENISKKSR